MKNKNLKRLNMSVVNIKPLKVVSSKKALKDVVPIPWSQDVLSGQKKVKAT